MKRFLITTALEETWRDDEPVLFLGEWCRRYSREDRWSRIDGEVLAYHWDDRAKLYADYQYLRDCYERLLEGTARTLNEIHAVDRSTCYWRILLGPWLGYFVQILFDRWTSIQQAVSTHALSETIVLTGREKSFVPTDMSHFDTLYGGDEWNHHLYATILAKSTSVRRVEQPRCGSVAGTATATPMTIGRRLRQNLARLYVDAIGRLARDEDAFFIGTYLPVRDEWRLQRRFGQFPQHWRSLAPAATPPDSSKRTWLSEFDSRSEFEACARALIPQQIPTLYLEGYAKLVAQTERLPWPARPKVIWTSSAHYSDDVFKAWAADKVSSGVPLVVGQHGGHYGTGLWSFSEEHEVAISDRYLSWGWSEPGQPKVTPVGQLKSKRPLGVRHADNSDVLLVTCVVPRYSYWMYSVLVSRQWLDYFEEQCSFVEALPESIRNDLTVRLFPHDRGWDQLLRWRTRLPSLRLDDGRSNMTDLIRRSRLFVSTYNATTYLESFTMNVPTVIYWNPNHWELRDSAIPYFEDLKRVAILHETPQSAARHVALIWDDVDAWWTSSDVRDVLKRFTDRYCDSPPDLLDRLEEVLKDTINAASVRVAGVGQ